jgi:hypothetical protein
MLRGLKHLAGIFLATLGVMFVIGSIAHMLNPESDIPLWMAIVFLVLLGFLPLAGAVALFRRTQVPPKNCPCCGSAEREPAGILRSAHHPWLFHTGGWLLASLWGASREQQVRCLRCDTLYFTPTGGSRVTGIVLWVFLLLALFGAIMTCLEEGF